MTNPMTVKTVYFNVSKTDWTMVGNSIKHFDFRLSFEASDSTIIFCYEMTRCSEISTPCVTTLQIILGKKVTADPLSVCLSPAAARARA